MLSQILPALILVPIFVVIGHWFSTQGRSTVAFRVIKLLHTAYGIVLGLTLLALSVSVSNQVNYEYWVRFFLTNMFVLLYLYTAVPFITGFLLGTRKVTGGFQQ
jgi:hypothetical protein